MRVVTLDSPDDFEGWRDGVRGLVSDRVPPADVVWQIGDAPGELFAPQASPVAAAGAFSVPRSFIDLARKVVLHTDRQRFALLHTLLLRLREQPALLEDQADPLVRKLEVFAKSVRRDIHKMRAFVRFREFEGEDGTRYVAWFEPEFHIVRANAAFFVDRFASMRWSILTPQISIHWDGDTLSEGAGAQKSDAPGSDRVEDIWKTYYASTFNPARVKIAAMLKEMPRRYWKNMPETALIPHLIANAQARESGMVANARIKIGGNVAEAWAALREEAKGCARCMLHKHATQTVFGEGPVDATMMFVGEQPGDQEDLAGHPFVGPAGHIFDRALVEAGIDRARIYVTNSVKHFKFERHGERRIHAKPGTGEISACHWWLEQERALLKPNVTVALGATAARSLFRKEMMIARERGRALELPGDGGEAWITIHPSYVLRLPDENARLEAFGRFVADLRAAAARVADFK